MKSVGVRIYLSLVLLVGIALAVLGFLVGQLFPFYIEKYSDEDRHYTTQAIDAVVKEEQLPLDDAQVKSLKKAVVWEDNTQEVTAISKEIQTVFYLLVVVIFAVIAMMAKQLVKKVVDPIDNVTSVALELADGNYRARAFENNQKNTMPLSRSINTLARNLEDITAMRAMEEERLKTLIENMGSALMMIGREGNVSLVNRVFLERFHKQLVDVQNENFKTIGLSKSLEKFIDHVFLTESPYRKQINETINKNVTHQEVYGAPVIGDHGHWLGVVVVMHDISDLIRLEQVRKDFVANVSHELRTPITSIKGFSETLLDGAYEDKEMLLAFLEIIYKESNRLQILVQDLLELSKIEQQGYSIKIAPTSLQNIIVQSVELTMPRLEEKDMQLNVEIAQDVIVMGDENRLMQVATNLITNAVTYSPEHTTVTLKIYETEDYGVLQVEDEGIGIAADEIPRLFERFYRVDRARSRNSGGTGLGLAIVKHFVEAHHGKIEVQSVEGKGTKMIVYLPKPENKSN